MNFKTKILFLLSDIFEQFAKIYNFCIIPFYYAFWFHNVPFTVISAVTVGEKRRLNNSSAISNGYEPEYPDEDSFCKIMYTFQHKVYAIAFHKNNPINLPPYNFNVYTKKKRPGIASIIVCSGTNEIDCTNELIPYAGPKLNFYNDLEDYTGLKWEWTELHKKLLINTDAKVHIMNTRGAISTSSYFSQQ